MLKEEFCKVLCSVDLKPKDVTAFKNAIKNQYHHNWIVDNLPAAYIIDTQETVSTRYVGYPVGLLEGKSTYYLYNHVNILLEYHTVEENSHRYNLFLSYLNY
jgi:transmembrane 9 superfamily protein 2/4